MQFVSCRSVENRQRELSHESEPAKLRKFTTELQPRLPVTDHPRAITWIERNMTTESQHTHSDSTCFPSELIELKDLIGCLEPPLRDLMLETEHRLELSLLRRNQMFNVMQDALEEARHETHHLRFDLHATKRERDHLAARLDDPQNGF